MDRNKKLIVWLLFILISFLIFNTSCGLVLDKAKAVFKGTFNYPGLRLETRVIDIKKIKNNFPRIVCFGDSVTFGWNLKYQDSYPLLLENLLSQNGYPLARTINSGVGGNTVLDGYRRLEKDVFYYKPHIVVLNFGLNDGMLIEISGNNFVGKKSLLYEFEENYYTPGVDLETFYQYYIKMINEIDFKGIKIILLGINPVLDTFPLYMDENFREKQKEVYTLYNKKILEVAENKDVICVDLWSIFLEKEDLEKYIQMDGIHPSKEGQALIANSVFLAIKESDIINKSK